MNTFSSLKRTANIRSRKHGIFTKKSEPLQIIVEEEEEPRPSCSSSKQRKQLAVSPSDIRIAKTPLEDAFDCDALLSEPPRPAPRPPSTSPTSSASSSPAGSPDSFRLTFTDASFKFPHPPIPTPSSSSWSPMPSPRSPRLPSSSPISSPSSQGTPLTPSSSDDECDADFRLAPAPTGFGLKRLRSIKPLVIVKHGRSQSAPAPSGPLPSLPTENAELEADIEFFRAPKMFAASPLPSSTGSSHSESDEEEEVSDSEWYSRDISRLLTLRSVLPPAFPKRVSASGPASAATSSSTLTAPTPTLRPESLCASIHVPPSPTKAGAYPSAQLDPDFPKRRSYLYPIPTRPPPPVPSSPVSPVTPSSVPATPITPATPVSASSTSTGSSRRQTRPPPRMSIPRDFLDSVIYSEGPDSASVNGESGEDGHVLYYYIQDFSSVNGEEGSSPSVYSQDSAMRTSMVASPFVFEASEETDAEDEDSAELEVLEGYEFDLDTLDGIAEESEPSSDVDDVQDQPPNLRLSLPTSLLSVDFERFNDVEIVAEGGDSDEDYVTEESYPASAPQFTNPFASPSHHSSVDVYTQARLPSTSTTHIAFSADTDASTRSRNNSADSEYSTVGAGAAKSTKSRTSTRSSMSSKLKLWLKTQSSGLTSSSPSRKVSGSGSGKTKTKGKGKSKRTVVVVGPSSSPVPFSPVSSTHTHIPTPLSPSSSHFTAIYGPDLIDLATLKSPKATTTRFTFGVPPPLSFAPSVPSTPATPMTPSSAYSMPSTPSSTYSTHSSRSPSTQHLRRSRSSRSTSTMSTNSCGCSSSGSSVLSSGSERLRRKPIPVEMFLRASN
ncbi:hypothetical protein D9758_006950 [Tetrapyrgos nigripes]|uniref:Uncharacterized protein n=1 Tax=Tetrapyrgos nigripes TaxID=182062 RepID=A0A8H5GSB5_9AGAR|nr:hypothetical protein D9758_006950 [Tetrapyrgos nigripes]